MKASYRSPLGAHRLSTYLRFGFLIAALVASLDLTAAARFWTLTEVRFDDGAIATGYFSYDDATLTSANWNVHVSGGAAFHAFTYVPGNSTIHRFLQDDGEELILFVSEAVGRYLYFYPLTPLDGSADTVQFRPLHDRTSEVGSSDGLFMAWGYRQVIAGSLTVSLAPPVVSVQVEEFYNPMLRHYFITASAAEQHDLDSGVHPGWIRTGQSFMARATGSSASGSMNAACRYYGNPLRGLDSHFYSADAGECAQVGLVLSADWQLESDNVFQINLPDKATGACAAETVPVYRLWNQRTDSNHRYTTSAAIRAEMLGTGLIAEGYGLDGIAMCALQ